MVATIAETSVSNPNSEYWASPRQYLNKSESSSYTANGDLAIKSVFVNVVSSAILNSQAGDRCTLVPRSMLQVLVKSLAFTALWGKCVKPKNRILLQTRRFRNRNWVSFFMANISKLEKRKWWIVPRHCNSISQVQLNHDVIHSDWISAK